MPSVDTIKTMAARDAGFDPNNPVTVLVHNLVKSFKPLYTILIVTCIWSAMLIPLFVVLMFFSNRELRRKPVFIGNVFAISVGITFSGLTLALLVSVLLDPLVPPSIPLTISFATLMTFSHILVESVLLIRLWAVYPFRSTPRKIFFAIFIPIILLKLGRVSNAIVYIVHLSKRVRDGESTLVLLQQIWMTFPNYMIEWTLQAVDNAVTSALFLAKLGRGRTLRSVTGGKLASTLDSLFWIAVYNFVIPVILSVVELIVIWTTTDVFPVAPICIVNLYVEIIGVLLATVWAAGTRWQDTHHKSTSSGVQVVTTVDVDIKGVGYLESAERQKRDAR